MTTNRKQMSPLRYFLHLILWTSLGTFVVGLGLEALQETNPQKMWAFIIGVSNYTHAEPLSFAATDAQSFADFLQSPRGGSVPEDHIALLLEDRATRTGIEYEMEQFWDKVQEGDTVYVYIAGHGFVHRRRIGYFLPIDGDPTSPNATSINLLALQQQVFFGFEVAQNLIMISDMCHSGVLADQQNAINQLMLSTFGEADPGKTFLNLVASASDEPSWEDGRVGHGVFTYTLLEGLNGQGFQSPSNLVDAKQLVQYVQQTVPERTANQQNPEVNESFDPMMAMAFLDRPGPVPVTPEAGTILLLVPSGQTPFLRAQWINPKNEAISVTPIPKDAPEVAIGPLAPGNLELTLFDQENHPRKVTLTLQQGENRLDLGKTQVGELQLSPRPPDRQVASLAVPATLAASPPALQNPVPTPSPAIPSPSLVLQLEPGTDVYVDGSLFANVQDDSRPLQLQGLSREPFELRLVYSPEHEQRFRLKLLPGPQWFDPATRQLKPIQQLGPPPAFSAPPAGLTADQQDLNRRFQQAIWEKRLIEPAGDSAWDYYVRLQPTVAPPFADELRRQLVVAMGDQAQRIILQYLSGGDVKWRAEDFDRGGDLTGRIRQLFKESDPYRSQEAFFRGRALIERKQFVEARDRLQESIQLQPEASHALNALGLAFWLQNQLNQALPPLEQAIELTPYWNYPRIIRALVLLQLRRYDESEAGFRGALQNDAEDSTAYHGLGQLYFITGRWRAAEPELLRAIEFDPGNAYAIHTLGQLQLRLQRFGEAEQNLRLAIRLEPDEAAFRLTLAGMLRQLGRVGEAGSVLADLVQRQPDNPEVLEAYGQFLGDTNRDSEAESAFQKAISLAPANANLRVSHGIFLLGKRRNDALEEFRRALKIDSNNAFAHYQLAEAFFADQKVDQAERSARQAIDADPRYAPPYRLLGQIAFARRQHDDALNLFRKARDLATEAHQKQEMEETIDRVESVIVDEQMGRVDDAERSGKLKDGWTLLAQTFERAPESRSLRNRILGYQAKHADAVDPSALPASPLREALSSRFWQLENEAEQMWPANPSGAINRFGEALGQLQNGALEALGSTAFNFENEERGLHAILYGWGLRALEQGEFQRVLDWMELARQRWIYAPVPDYSPLTVDSLMRPADIPNPQRFEEFEVAHHPDHRAHELLAAAWAGEGDLQQVARYLEALEFRGPDLQARSLAARALHRTGRNQDAEKLLRPALDNNAAQDNSSRREQGWLLLAQIQCAAGRCDEARATLERGLRELSSSDALKKALRELRQ